MMLVVVGIWWWAPCGWNWSSIAWGKPKESWKMEDVADQSRWEKPVLKEDVDNDIAAVVDGVDGGVAAVGVSGGFAYLGPYWIDSP